MIFIAKYNSQGQVQWAKTINSLLYDKATEILTDENKNIYVTGCFRGSSVDFDLDNALDYDTKSSVSGRTAYIAKYEPVSGDLVWLKTIEGGSSSDALDMVVKDDKIIVGGQFQGNVSMGSLSLDSDDLNPLIAIIDTAGNWLSLKKIEKGTSSAILNLFITPNEAIHFMGFMIEEISSSGRIFNLDGIFIGEAFYDELTNREIDQILSSEKLEIVPNPSSEILYIKSSFEIKQLSLFDISGNLILCQSKKNQVDIKKLPKGLYVVKVIADSGIIYSEKVVKE